MSDPSGFGEFDLLRRLTEASGVPGREERIREIVLAETEGLWDETHIDNMGNLICLKRATTWTAPGAGKKKKAAAEDDALHGAAVERRLPTPPLHRPQRVMIACHMDEIGFYVRYIDDQGRLRVINAGGFDTRNLFARRVRVHGKKELLGVMNPGGRPVHLATDEERRKIPEMQEFYVDLFMPRREVERLVQVGDPVTLVQDTHMIGDAINGKAMDNRVALWTAINAIRRVHGGPMPPDVADAPDGKARKKARKSERPPGSRYDIYFVACVQEEVGLRGAQTAAFTVEPDIGIAIDVTLACDTPGISKDDSVTTFGGGAAIKVMDSASISHRGLFEEFVHLAQKKKIKYQLEVLPRGGTDAGAVQRARGGTRAITLSVPTRYIHTVTESVHRGDALAAVDLLSAWLSA